VTRAVRRAIVLAGLVIGAFEAAMPAVDAHELVRTAWWSRSNQGDLDLSAVSPSPPPEGGVAVGATPEGAIATAAVRFTLEPGETAPVLTLPVDTTSTNSDAAGVVLLACQSGAAWSAGGGQAWDTAPPAVCAADDGGGSVVGERSTDGASWSFALGPLQLGSEIDVVLVPATTDDAPPVAPYQINFVAPSSDALTTQAASESAALPAVGGTDAPGLPAVSTQPSASVAMPAMTAPASMPFVPALPESAQQLTPTAPAVRLGAISAPVVDAVAGETAWWVRLLAIFLTLAACAALFVELRAGDDDQPEERGIGGLVALRSGPPPTL
jgi:hypothetical protein